MRYVNATVLSAVDTASQTGSAIDTNQIISVSFHAVFGDGTAAGTVKVQASNDLESNYALTPGGFTPTNWVDIPNASAAITAGAAGLITITQSAYRWMRVVYTRTSGGSSTVTVNMFGFSV